VLRDGEPILNYPLSEQVDTGITYESLIPDAVSVYEEREACIKNNYNWAEWQNLTWQEKAEAVAFYRLSGLLDLHRNDALTRDIKRKRVDEWQ
jgi:hypothetical protein